MAQHLLKIFYNLFLVYFFIIDTSYIWYRYIKKDKRFLNIGLFKYLESPIKTLKGDK